MGERELGGLAAMRPGDFRIDVTPKYSEVQKLRYRIEDWNR